MSVADFNQRVERRRQEKDALDNMLEYHAANSLLRATAESDRRVEVLRRTKFAQQQQQALLADQRIEAELQARESRRKAAEEDEALARGMYELQTAQQSKELRERRICEQSPELIELKHLLQAAATNRQRTLQLQEKKIIKEHEAMLESMLDQTIERERQEAVRQQEIEAQKRLLIDKDQYVPSLPFLIFLCIKPPLPSVNTHSNLHHLISSVSAYLISPLFVSLF